MRGSQPSATAAVENMWEVALTLMANASELLASVPQIRKANVLADKLLG